jgi:hypothetical protein
LSFVILRRTRRRSVSICVSPGPRTPLAPREDVEDQRRPVQHLDAERVLEVRLLRRRQLVIEDDHRVAVGVTARLDLVDLTLADVCRRIRCVEALQRRPHDLRAGSASEQRQLVERALAPPAVARAGALDANQIRLLRLFDG